MALDPDVRRVLFEKLEELRLAEGAVEAFMDDLKSARKVLDTRQRALNSWLRELVNPQAKLPLAPVTMDVALVGDAGLAAVDLATGELVGPDPVDLKTIAGGE